MQNSKNSVPPGVNQDAAIDAGHGEDAAAAAVSDVVGFEIDVEVVVMVEPRELVVS